MKILHWLIFSLIGLIASAIALIGYIQKDNSTMTIISFGLVIFNAGMVIVWSRSFESEQKNQEKKNEKTTD